MQTAKTIQIPERLRVVVTLAGLLERMEVDVQAGGASQYRSVIEHLSQELRSLEGDAALDMVLGMFPATSELYENLHYAHAGLCRAPLELSLNSEMQARAAIDCAARMAARAAHKPHHPHSEPDDEPEPGLHPVDPDQGPIAPPVPDDADDGRPPSPEV